MCFCDSGPLRQQPLQWECDAGGTHPYEVSLPVCRHSMRRKQDVTTHREQQPSLQRENQVSVLHGECVEILEDFPVQLTCV
ncbi:hypothetical protein GDO78_022733 [Eleutherodactylus coqui]|uniref:Uncharacterized protein n=1 Tax=Eleutherodactylus coqui TaxID=57060 RepID=A0A8J6C4M4_ELECQ|nr:hypothetical protein GDO78_022733 [Eleutherodactylus coqui]